MKKAKKRKSGARKKESGEVLPATVTESVSETRGIIEEPFQPHPDSGRDRLLLFFFSWLFFLINLKYPITRNFDEFHYVPSAYQWLDLIKNQNWEHPPLAKQLMTLGLYVFGDDPIGWRFSSTLFGAVTLVAIHGAAETLFRSRKAATLCFVISFLDQLIYVQSRIAMLDTFMMAFLMLGFWAALRAAYGRTVVAWKPLALAGASMGLAICSKWFSLVPFAIGGILLVFTKAIRPRGEVSSTIRWRNLRVILGSWGVVALVTYYLPFGFYFLVPRQPRQYSVWELLWDFQWTMLSGQKSVGGNHPYMSQWWSWPIMMRPIWYAFDQDPQAREWTRGVVLLGNPAIMWGGLVAIAWSAYEAVRAGWAKLAQNEILLQILYWGCLLSWALIPRKLTFYYYYYPNGILLGFFLTAFFMKRDRPRETYAFLAVCGGLFAYFFPILAALRIPSNGLGFYMWFRNWI